MARRSRSSRSMAVGGVLFLAALLLIVVVGYFVGDYFENQSVREERAVMSEGFGRYEEKIFNGKRYYKKTNLTTLLLIGVDRDTTVETRSYRNGGQADFLVLLVLDHDDKTIRQLQIERDTMTAVDVLTILGKPGGTRTLQICLSHGYGADQTACCENTVNAVSHYLDNIDIDLYMAVDYSAISKMNDLLGGVTVTLTEDFSHLDPEMTLGKTIRLQGKQAELFVRSRMSVGDGTNAQRQLRQRVWMTGAVDLLKAKIKSDPNFFDDMVTALGDGFHTNAGQGRLINEFNQAWQYSMGSVEQIAGEYTIGSDGFVEYHTQPEAVSQWVVDAMCRPAT